MKNRHNRVKVWIDGEKNDREALKLWANSISDDCVDKAEAEFVFVWLAHENCLVSKGALRTWLDTQVQYLGTLQLSLMSSSHSRAPTPCVKGDCLLEEGRPGPCVSTRQASKLELRPSTIFLVVVVLLLLPTTSVSVSFQSAVRLQSNQAKPPRS